MVKLENEWPDGGGAATHREAFQALICKTSSVLAIAVGDPPTRQFDVCIVGAGILGTCMAFWLSEQYECSVALVDKEQSVAFHASSRNTGVVHRPFYLHPERKKKFAWAAQRSYPLWERLARAKGLPWRKTGVVEVATDERSLPVLNEYRSWGITNGMGEDEIELLDPSQVKAVEPLVKCSGAIYSKTDASVDYRRFTEAVLSLAQENGIVFLGATRVQDIGEDKDGYSVEVRRADGGVWNLSCGLLVNASGGGALPLAHKLGLAQEYAQLHFRGDYWQVTGPISSQISHNIYSVPRRMEYPFLDPHFIVRADGRAEIGPNAAVVAGPYVYDGFTGGSRELISRLLERPVSPKLKLLFDPEFLSLAWTERKRSISKKAMCDGVGEFIPSLAYGMLGGRGVGGVRNALISTDGFIPEALEMWSGGSLHIMNYNSPGATGAPAYSAKLVAELATKGLVDGLHSRAKQPHASPWDFDETVADVPTWV